MVGMLAPEFEEIVTGEAEVREVFRVPRIGADRRLLRARRRRSPAARRSASCARASSSGRAPSPRCAASRTTSARCRPASSAGSGSPTSRTSRRATSSRPSRSARSRGPEASSDARADARVRRRGRSAGTAERRTRYPRALRVNQVLRAGAGRGARAAGRRRRTLRLVTVTAVDTAPDLRHATVYLSSLDEDAGRGPRGAPGPAAARRRAPGPDEAHPAARASPSTRRSPRAPGSRRSCAGCTSEEPRPTSRTRRGRAVSDRGDGERHRPGRRGQGGRLDLPRRRGPVPADLRPAPGGSRRHPRPRRHRGAAGRPRPGHPAAALPDRAAARPTRARSCSGTRHVDARRLRRGDRHLGHGRRHARARCGRRRPADRRDRAGPADGVGGQGRRPPPARAGPRGHRGRAGGPAGHRLPLRRRARPGAAGRLPDRGGLLVGHLRAGAGGRPRARRSAAAPTCATSDAPASGRSRPTDAHRSTTSDPTHVLTPAQALRDLDQVVGRRATPRPRSAPGWPLDRVPLGVTGDGPWALVDEARRAAGRVRGHRDRPHPAGRGAGRAAGSTGRRRRPTRLTRQ